MGITKRFIYLLFFGVLLLAFTILLNNSFSIFILYNLIAAAFLIIDYFISIKEADIVITRLGTEELSIYEKETIAILIYNKSDYKLNIEILDEVPDFYFKTENKLMKGIVLPHEKTAFQYFVVPSKRGAFTFNNLHVKYKGRLKICTKMFKSRLDREYRVYPNLKNLSKYRMSMCTNRMLKQGQRNMKILGKGTSFESLREYVQGDEYRKINWKATARENKLIVNQYEPEKNQHVYMFIDAGRPLSYTVRGYRKLDMVVNTSLLLSDMVNQNGDKSALLLFNSSVNNMIAPGKGPGHRTKILNALYHVQSNNETSNYDEAFYYFKKKEQHRSIVFLFTDFDTIEEAENMIKVMPIISKDNIIIIILIKNEGLEGISSMKIKNQEDMFNKGVALELLEERRKIISMLNGRGLFCIECAPEKLELTALNKYIQVKNQSYL